MGKHEAEAISIIRRIAAGERLLMIFRWWLPFQTHFIEWEAGGDPPTYPAVKLAGKRGWMEPQRIDDERQLIVLTDLGRQQLTVPFGDAGANI